MHWDEQTLRRTIAAAFEQGGLDAICQLVISLLSEQEARHQASSRNQRNSWRTVCLVLAIPFMIQAMELALSPTLASMSGLHLKDSVPSLKQVAADKTSKQEILIQQLLGIGSSLSFNMNKYFWIFFCSIGLIFWLLFKHGNGASSLPVKMELGRISPEAARNSHTIKQPEKSTNSALPDPSLAADVSRGVETVEEAILRLKKEDDAKGPPLAAWESRKMEVSEAASRIRDVEFKPEYENFFAKVQELMGGGSALVDIKGARLDSPMDAKRALVSTLRGYQRSAPAKSLLYNNTLFFTPAATYEIAGITFPDHTDFTVGYAVKLDEKDRITMYSWNFNGDPPFYGDPPTDGVTRIDAD